MQKSWSEPEVAATVEDYFNMLQKELSDQKYNKSEHRRALIKHLNHRSDGAIELKHQNISAVLIEMGIPYIDGYKPRSNYQRSLLPDVITKYLAKHPELYFVFQKDSELVPHIPSVADILSTIEKPPHREEADKNAIKEPTEIYIPHSINYLQREADNQTLGEAGEQFVMNFERARLIFEGKESLADQVEQISLTVGPTAGFDIRSFETDGTDRFIETKTTKYGKNTPFFVTPNELRFSQHNMDRYFLYRVFKFRKEPRLFMLTGRLDEQCQLLPSEYLARADI